MRDTALRSVSRPRITGWAQLRYGYASSLQEETKRVRYDLYDSNSRSGLIFTYSLFLLR